MAERPPASPPQRQRRTARPMQVQLVPVKVDDITAPFYVRYDEFGAGTWADAHSHRLGHLNYTPHGTISMETGISSARARCPATGPSGSR